MSTETGKNHPEKVGKGTEHTDSNYAMPEDMSTALQKLIVDRLMKISSQVKRLEADTGDGGDVEVGWEEMPSAAKEFHARSAQNITDEDLDAVATDG